MSFKPSHNSKRPSLTSPMSWLTRSSSSASSQTLHTQSVPAAKPVRISEPKVKVSMPHVGGLGFGATVVRTPDDALAGSGVRVEHGSEEQLEQPEQQRQSCIDEESETEDSSEEIYDEYVDNSIQPATPPKTPPRSSLPLSKSSPTFVSARRT
ncbi:hypothetical protein EWM64_g4038 [Hericium alpestre]|uniref:Uncharacterized protein n=1 Tax=Hericium alpestre TaxID=135208 RepID=A0A4Z0A0X2_9AGAM|nr:hypothetical protein EWM64_g4038 [Hericium alpestre]